MKNTVLILFILTALSCSNQSNSHFYNSQYDILISYNFYKVDSTFSRDYLDKKFLRDGNLYLIFEHGFSQDSIKIRINGKEKISELITTEPSTSVAKEYKFESIESIKSVGIRLNNGKEAVVEIDTMNFYLINFNNSILKIRVPKSVPFYD